MKRKLLILLPLAAIAGIVSSGCGSTPHTTVVLVPTGRTDVVATQPITTTSTTQTVVVSPGPPPPPRTEVMGAPPAPTTAWVAGYWNWANGGWVWTPGYWQARPSVTAVWVAGHWDPNPNGTGWVWTPGYWQ